jgi:hypothetical protein
MARTPPPTPPPPEEEGARPSSGAVTTRTSPTSTPPVRHSAPCIKDTTTNNQRAAVASSNTTTNKNENRDPWVLRGSDSSEDENWPKQRVLRGVHQMLKSDSIETRVLLWDPHMHAGLERQDCIDEE